MGRSPKPSRDDVTRIQVELRPASLKRLQDLQQATEAASYAEVVRNALRLYEALIQETSAGNQILIKRDKNVSPLYIFEA